MDSQSVKIAPESAHISGFDGHKRVKGREAPSISRYARHPAVLLCDACQYARYEKRARRLLAGLKYFVPRLTTIWADSAYRGKDLADWRKTMGDWDLEVVGHVPGVRGLALRPKRWIVERTFGWLSCHRRLSKDYERKVPA